MYALVGVSAELAEQLVAIEADGEDAVHQARTRVRRLRGILSVYKKAFDREAERRMRERLKGLGRRLGNVRELEVRAAGLRALADGQDVEPVRAAASALADRALEQHERALDDLLHLLRSRGHRELLADLQQFAADPPLSEPGRDAPKKIARKGLKKAVRRVRRSEGDTLEQRHATRKASRRLRYAAEAVGDDLGDRSLRLASAAETVQDALGDNRDLLLLARHLREAAPDGTLDAVAAACEARAAEALTGLDDALAVIEWG
ncbi:MULTISPECIES: CHAD domain-containing protein [unclassified Leifsonia]|uniref:CHAD domain-containing protein n=1 Tax=unclassified Leifsonia TaxID=2663824 RepID=UPI0008A79D8E|nr:MULTISPECIES: CHAD domain-containing protein [unclassified Leifsonia]SEI17474.1 CHAD domain-containing protein [Leifsonia sp. CL154]SFL91539.1 CHAD domain-containing protein [Leifsonia sp. CL147]